MFNEAQEKAGAALVAAFICPYVLRRLAKKLDDPGLAISILRYRVNDPAMEGFRKAVEDGKFSDEDRLAVEREVDVMVARYNEFHEVTDTEEEFTEKWGEEGKDWMWYKTIFGECRIKIKQ